MKYIVIKQKVSDGLYQEIPIMFPNDFVHSAVAEMFLKDAHFNNRPGEVISAGFIHAYDVECHGKSTTLELSSREEIDDLLIKGYDYNHGLVSD